MRLLLDAHHSPVVATRLREAGHDVIAAAVDRVLVALADDALLELAAAQDRVVVTENASDFDRIIREWSALGRHHAGVVFTSPRRLHRGAAAYPGNLIGALLTLLTDPPPTTADWVHWLE